jgi:3-mercaptopyruvate sulfurtransferase SseA
MSILGGTMIGFALLACSAVQPFSSPAIPTEDPYLEIPRVTVEEAAAALNSGAAVFVDVRGAAQYGQGHVAGALSIPLGDIIEGRTGDLDPNDWIITYCT